MGAALALVYFLRSVLAPYALGLVLAYILAPLVSWTETRLPFRRPGTRRFVSIAAVYVVGLGLMVVFIAYMVGVVAGSFSALGTSGPRYVLVGIDTLQQWTDGLRRELPTAMVHQVDLAVDEAGIVAANAIRGAVARSIAFIPETISLILGYLSLPIFLFYLLKDYEGLTDGFYSAVPDGAYAHTRNVIAIIKNVMGRSVRALMVEGFTIGLLDFAGLMALGIPFAVPLGVFAGITEVIPVVGPWLGGAVAVTVALATVPERAVWVAVLFLGVQVVGNVFLSPRLQGGFLRVHPAVVIMLIPIGAQISGILGMMLVVPFTATVVEVYKYVFKRCSGECETV